VPAHVLGGSGINNLCVLCVLRSSSSLTARQPGCSSVHAVFLRVLLSDVAVQLLAHLLHTGEIPGLDCGPEIVKLSCRGFTQFGDGSVVIVCTLHTG
jgi:hypothetical protein